MPYLRTTGIPKLQHKGVDVRLDAWRKPLQDWNVPLKEALTRQTLNVGNRTMKTCLVGIPLHGDLGAAFEQVFAVKDILREIQSAKLLAKDDGLIFLDQPLPRSTIKMMSIEDLYSLTHRLFERGVRGSTSPVVDARITESDLGLIDSAMMVGLLYWDATRQNPRLLYDASAQAQLATVVEKHIAFGRSTPSRPQPSIQSQPMQPFLDATVSSSQQIIRRYLDNLLISSEITPDAATFNIVSTSAPWGEYYIEVVLQESNVLSKCQLSLCLDELRDGNICTMLNYLIGEMADRGVINPHIAYQQTKYAKNADGIIRSAISLH